MLPLLQRLPPARNWWLAYSGGLDSEVLLHALAHLRPRVAADLHALHVHHGLSAAADDWTVHCAQTCERLGVSLTIRRVGVRARVGESPEAVARAARYRALREPMGAGDLLMTAHHRDDQAETLLLALLRGSGVSGLAAMPECARFPPGHLIRPLLGFTRGELSAFAHATGLTWVEDASNRDLGHDRNFLRHRVLPLLAERWPAYARTLARSAGHCAEAQQLIDRLAGERQATCAGSRPERLSLSRLGALDAPLARAVLRHWIKSQGFRLPNRLRLERVLAEVLTAAPDRRPLVTWPGCEIRRYRDDLYLLEPLPKRPGPLRLRWEDNPLRLPDPLGRLRVLGEVPGDAVVDVRFRAGGEVCRPAGKAHRKPLKKLFQEAGIPDWLRDYVPLIYIDGELAAVAGLALCDWFATHPAVGVRWEGHPWETILVNAAR